MKIWLAVALLIGLGTGGEMVAQSSHTPYADDAAMKQDDVFSVMRDAWARNLREKRVEASVAAYAADAEFVNPDGSRVQGTAALRQLFATVTATLDSDLVFSSQRAESVGNYAFDSGSYSESLTVRATGKAQRASGSYLTVYRHGKEGVWLIVEQDWTGAVSDAAPVNELDPHPVVALTFDDLPAAGSLPPGMNRTKIATALSAELKAMHLEGTYGFVNAAKMESDPEAQQALHIWVDAGMNVGSHTWSHISLTDNPATAFEDEIARNEPALEAYGQTRDWRWFRYPFLWEGDTLDKRHAVRAYLAEHGYRVAQVSLDFEDYAWNDPYARCVAKGDTAAIAWLKETYLSTATEYIRLGREEQRIALGHEIPDVLLLHETAFTTLMLPQLAELLRSQGFRFAGLAEVERNPAYAQDPDAALKYGGTLPDQFMDSRHLKYPPFKPKPFKEMDKLCR